MTAWLKRFLRDESGSGVEKAILVSGIALLVVPTVNSVGGKLASVFGKLIKALQ